MPDELKNETERAHHFDRPGVFEVDEVSGAGIALRTGETLAISYKIPSEMLPEIVRLLNEEREARYEVIVTTISTVRAENSHDANEARAVRSYIFTGYDARRRAQACLSSELKRELINGPGIGHDVAMTRNGALVLNGV